MVCRGKTRERGGDKGLNGNSSPCVPLPLTAAGRLVAPILDSSAAPTLSVLPRLPLFSSPSSSARQVAAEVLPFHSLTPSALQPRPRGLRVQRFVCGLHSQEWALQPDTSGQMGGGTASRHGKKR